MRRVKLQGIVAAGVLFAALAGCVAEPSVEAAGLTSEPRPTRVPVVAVLDSGVNPYHERFVGGIDVQKVLESNGVTHQILEMHREGSYRDRVAADAGEWKAAREGALYAFPGTRLAAITFSDRISPPILDYYPGFGHGSGVASLVARDAPDAVIIVVQVYAELCRDTACFLDPSVARGMEWIAAQPWIDIVSVSIATPANAPDDPRVHAEMAAYLAATRQAHESGKIIVNGAGNTPPPPITDYFNGPPWVIAVGGFEPIWRGEASTAAKTADVIGNYSDYVATRDSVDEYVLNAGTSFATPIVAATLAQALSIHRREISQDADEPQEAKRRTAFALREALNVTAQIVPPTEWRPQDPTNLSRPPLRSLPMLAPGPQGGWGYVHAGLAERIAEEMMRPRGIPDEKQNVARFQALWQESRERYWSVAPS